MAKTRATLLSASVTLSDPVFSNLKPETGALGARFFRAHRQQDRAVSKTLTGAIDPKFLRSQVGHSSTLKNQMRPTRSPRHCEERSDVAIQTASWDPHRCATVRIHGQHSFGFQVDSSIG
jgi:hypothetical protein